MKRFVRKCILYIVIMVLLTGTGAVPAGAVTRKLVNQSYTRVRTKADSKAKSVKAGTVTVVIPSKGKGFLRFKAPADGTYRFTLSKLKAKKIKQKTASSSGKKKTKKIRPFSNGYFYVMQSCGRNSAGGEIIGQAMLATSGGRTNTLWLATREMKTGNEAGWRLKKRTGTLSLAKDEVVYLYFNFTPGDRVKLKIAA